MDYEEYDRILLATPELPTNGVYSYEALPPNFSILENCAAGAFAGIAVGMASYNVILGTNHRIGALSHVSC